MPTRGRPPKDEGQRINRVPLQHTYLTIPNVPYEPTAAQKRCPVPNAHTLTKAWWAMVSTLPHARQWGEGEWAFARATCFVHEDFITKRTLAKELRDRERAIGTTEDARRALRIRYAGETVQEEPVAEGEPMKPIELDRARRERLAGG